MLADFTVERGAFVRGLCRGGRLVRGEVKIREMVGDARREIGGARRHGDRDRARLAARRHAQASLECSENMLAACFSRALQRAARDAVHPTDDVVRHRGTVEISAAREIEIRRDFSGEVARFERRYGGGHGLFRGRRGKTDLGGGGIARRSECKRGKYGRAGKARDDHHPQP